MVVEPFSLIGAVGVVVQIGDAVWKLQTLRSKYKDAHKSVTMLISRLSSMKSVLNNIQELIETESIASPDHPKVKETLADSVGGCREAVESLNDEVSTFEETADAMGVLDRFRYLKLEKDLREREFTLQTHMAALQIALQAVQCTSYREQTELLGKKENKEVIQRAADETASLRASRAGSAGARSATASVISGRRTVTVGTLSIINDTESITTETQGVLLPKPEPSREEDVGLGISGSGLNVETVPLQKKNLQHHTSKAGRVHDPRERIQEYVDKTHEHKRSKSAEDTRLETPEDEGYETKSATDASSHLSPSWTPMAEREFRPFRDRAEGFDTADIYQNKSLNTSGNHVRTKSDPFAFISSQQQVSPKEKSAKKKISLFSLRRSRTPSASSLESLEEEPTVRRRRSDKESEGSYFRSIDFGSPDGLQAPHLVRAAQSGSAPEVEKLLDRGAPIDARHQKSGKTALAVAAHCGNTDIVDLLIQARATIDTFDSTHSTPLHLAASRGHCSAMRHLIRAQAQIEERDSEGRTPLWLAARHGYLPAVELLVRHRAKVNTRDSNNQITALQAAAMQGDVAMVELLLQQGAHIDAKDNQSMSAIHHACERGHKDVIQVLLREKASVESSGSKSQTPLITAAAAGQHHVLELLLKCKAQLKAKSDKGMTALHVASKNGHVEAVDLLLKKKMSIDHVNEEGQTPLHLAVMCSHFDIVELLLRKKCDVEKKCNRGYSPLHYSCASNNVDVVRILVNSGAQVEKASMSDRAKPIHIATAHGDVQTVRMLLQRRVSLEARDIKEERPLCIACRIGNVEVVEAILDAGSPIRSKYSVEDWSHEDSPLCVASRRGHLEICSLLITRGASVRHRDEYDWQPLRYAAFYGHPEVVQLLLQNGAELGAAGSSWGFEMTAARVGFAIEPFISQDRKDRVLQLLDDAEQQEAIARKARAEEEIAYAPPMSETGSAATELMDRQNSVRVRREILERRPSEVPTDHASNVYPATAYDPPPPAPTTAQPPFRSATTAGNAKPPIVRSVPLQGNPSPYTSIFDNARSDNTTPPPGYFPAQTSASDAFRVSSVSPSPFSTVSSSSPSPAPQSMSGINRAMTQLASSSRPSSASQVSRTLSGGMRYNSGLSAMSNRDSMQLNRPPDTIEEEPEFPYDNPDSFSSRNEQYPAYEDANIYLGVSEMPNTEIARTTGYTSSATIFEMPDTSIPANRLQPPSRTAPPPPNPRSNSPLRQAYVEDVVDSDNDQKPVNSSTAKATSTHARTTAAATTNSKAKAGPQPESSTNYEKVIPSTFEAQNNASSKRMGFVEARKEEESDHASIYDVSASASEFDATEAPPQVTLNRINSDNVTMDPVVLAPRLRRFSFEEGDDSGRNTPDITPMAHSSEGKNYIQSAESTASVKVPAVQTQLPSNATAAKDSISKSPASENVPTEDDVEAESKRRSDQEMSRRLLEGYHSQQQAHEDLANAEKGESKGAATEPGKVASTSIIKENITPAVVSVVKSGTRPEVSPKFDIPLAHSATLIDEQATSVVEVANDNEQNDGIMDTAVESNSNKSKGDDSVEDADTPRPSKAAPHSPPPLRQPPPPPPPVAFEQTNQQYTISAESDAEPKTEAVASPTRPPLRSPPLSPGRPEQDRGKLWDDYRRRTQIEDDSSAQTEQPTASTNVGPTAATENRAIDWEYATDEEKIAAGGVEVYLDGIRYIFPP